MPQYPGNNTVNFITVTYDAAPDRLGVTGPRETSNSQVGCAMQPISGKDQITDTMYSEATWKCISPATSVTVPVEAEDFVQFNGDKYRVLMVKPFYDRWARLTHITFYCKEENG